MKADTQRNKYKPLRFAWRWEVCIRGPPGSAYEGDSYRVLVRLPLAFPATPPKLHFLSIMSHLEVETRDPYEGQLDESFYERLAERTQASKIEASGGVRVGPNVYTIRGALELLVEALNGPLLDPVMAAEAAAEEEAAKEAEADPEAAKAVDVADAAAEVAEAFADVVGGGGEEEEGGGEGEGEGGSGEGAEGSAGAAAEHDHGEPSTRLPTPHVTSHGGTWRMDI